MIARGIVRLAARYTRARSAARRRAQPRKAGAPSLEFVIEDLSEANADKVQLQIDQRRTLEDEKNSRGAHANDNGACKISRGGLG